MLLLGALLAVLVAACGSSHSASGVKGQSEIAAQGVSTKGTNPFTPPVGQDHAGIKPPAAAASSSGGPATYVGNLPGLYGGTRNISTCDAKQLVSFLEQNPAKAAAWAGVLGIQPTQISSYVDGLTAVILRTDTRVTNHGYADGHVTTLQSVLEAGTAVLVDQYGRPTVKCYCGNPLTAPALYASPVYTGSLWPGFSTSSITIIQQSTTIIKQFIIYDPSNGMLYPQTPGVNGKSGPYQQPGGGTSSGSTSTPPARSTPTPAPTPAQPSSTPQPTENPSVSLSPNPVTAGDTVSLSATGFAPNTELAITVDRPDGATDHFSTGSGSDGSASYTFPNAGGSQTGSYTVTVTNPNTGAHASATIEVVASSGQTTTT